jgi:hypothetical protein
VNTEKINKLQFLHKVRLTNTASSIVEICDKSGVKESDIFTVSAFLYFLSKKSAGERINTIYDFSMMTKAQRKELPGDPDADGKLQRIVVENFYRKISLKKIMLALQLSDSDGASLVAESYDSFLQQYVTEFHEDFADERFIKEFVNLVEVADYSNAVRLYFLAICLGRNRLMDTFSRIQRDKCRSNFIYALNRKVILIGTLLVKYGKGKEVEILAEQTIELSNEAVDEANRHVAELQERFVEYEKEISCLEGQLAESHKTNTELRMEIAEINNHLILENVKVLVVGDEGHIEGYRKIVEEQGGRFDFTSGVSTKGATAKRKALGADLVFLITTWAQHEVTRAIEGFANIVRVNSAGLESFEREVLKLRNRGE